MSSTQAQSGATSKAVPSVQPAEMKIEVIVIPVADVDRAKRFYANLGWRLDVDVAADGQYRIVQFTPPARRARSFSVRESPQRHRARRRGCT
jgi:catechol 2,3-dioxygenase-like lactoylglutathione lyase family enzyme